MPYSDLTLNSPSRLKRLSHGKRFRVAVDLIAPRASERILDFGTGDGYLLQQLATASPTAEVIGYEPDQVRCREAAQRYRTVGNIRVVSTLSEFGAGSFDKICCLEVMEHLLKPDLEEALESIRRLIDSSGSLVISVPIEIGAAAIVKYSVRRSLGHLEPGMTVWTVLKSVLGYKVDRYQEPTCYGHTGFDYRELETKLSSVGFQIESREFSPIPALRGALNSQVFYKLRKISDYELRQNENS